MPMTSEEIAALLKDPERARKYLEQQNGNAPPEFDPDEITDITELARAFKAQFDFLRDSFTQNISSVKKDLEAVRTRPDQERFQQEVKEMETKSGLFAEEKAKVQKGEKSELLELADSLRSGGRSIADAWAMALKASGREDTPAQEGAKSDGAGPKPQPAPIRPSVQQSLTHQETQELSSQGMSIREAIDAEITKQSAENPAFKDLL